MKRTDFLVHKAQFLVGVTGFEPAASTSQIVNIKFKEITWAQIKPTLSHRRVK